MTQLEQRAVQERPSVARPSVVVVRMGEITLKKRNRPYFVRQLGRNVRRALKGLDITDLELSPNRALVTAGPAFDWPEARERLRRVFGVKNFSLCEMLPWDVDAIRETVLRVASGHSFESFRITVQRSDKRFPGTSQELERSLGAVVKAASGARVDLEHPEANFQVEIMPGGAYVHTERVEGPAGLPVGVSGRVVALLSGGIDSPVAAWRLMSRGCQVTFVHFQSFPYLDASSRDKAIALARLLTRWQYKSRLHVVSFGDVQHQIVASCPPPLRVVLYRRFMVRIAEAIAKRERAEALVTGESLGQVSSQTLSNMATIDAVATLPVLRPHVGSDKDEIIREARALGTFETSIEPDQDCCTLFVPRNPATRSTVAEAEDAERALDVPALVEQGLATVETLEFSWPDEQAAAETMPAAELRRAVAAVVRRADGFVLAVRRPDEPGEELRGVWGLPATTLREDESPEDGVRRLGREKLGVELTPLRAIGQGEEARTGYALGMTVYDASMVGEPRLPAPGAAAGVTLYDGLEWLPEASFYEAASKGSLCCRLLLASTGG